MLEVSGSAISSGGTTGLKVVTGEPMERSEGSRGAANLARTRGPPSLSC